MGEAFRAGFDGPERAQHGEEHADKQIEDEEQNDADTAVDHVLVGLLPMDPCSQNLSSSSIDASSNP